MVSQSKHWGVLQAAIGHEPPYITSNVFDFRTTELISITVAEQDCWIPKLLETYKNNLITDYRYKTAYLIYMLNNNGYDGWLDNVEYANALQNLPSDTCNLDLHGTPLSINYFCDCKANNKDANDPANFESYMANEMDFGHYYSYFNSDYLTHSREWCGSRAELYTKVDFRELFFDLRVPNQGALANVDLGKIAEYSQQNLDILDKSINVMPLSQRESLWDRVYLLRQEFERAKLRN